MKEIFLFNYKTDNCLECFSLWKIETTNEICCFTLKFGKIKKNTLNDMYNFLNLYSIL